MGCVHRKEQSLFIHCINPGNSFTLSCWRQIHSFVNFVYAARAFRVLVGFHWFVHSVIHVLILSVDSYSVHSFTLFHVRRYSGCLYPFVRYYWLRSTLSLSGSVCSCSCPVLSVSVFVCLAGCLFPCVYTFVCVCLCLRVCLWVFVVCVCFCLCACVRISSKMDTLNVGNTQKLPFSRFSQDKRHAFNQRHLTFQKEISREYILISVPDSVNKFHLWVNVTTYLTNIGAQVNSSRTTPFEIIQSTVDWIRPFIVYN